MNPKRLSRLLPFRLLAACFLAVSLRAADVKSFGARGDGGSDDTAAIQRAVDAGGGVQFTSGTYRITRTIAIDLAKTGVVALTGDGTARVVMAGAGPAFAFSGTITGSAAPAQIGPAVWERERMPRVDGLEIVGAHPEADGIAATGTMQLSISRVLIREARHGIHLQRRNRNVLISDSHIYNNRGVGILYEDVDLHQSNITGTHISYNAGGGIVVRGSGHVRNLHVANCDIEANMTPDGPPTANILLDSTSGSVGEVAITGCTIQHRPAPGCANIRIVGHGIRGRNDTTPTNEGQVTIASNVINDTHVNIHLRGARGVAITGNSIGLGVEHDLLVEESRNIIIGANSIDQNPRYPDARKNDRRGGIVFRDSRDCSITGLHMSNVHAPRAALVFEGCTRLQVSDVSVLDSDHTGIELRDSSLVRLAGSVVRDDREPRNPTPSLIVHGGRANVIVDNLLDRPARIADDATAVVRGNEIIAR